MERKTVRQNNKSYFVKLSERANYFFFSYMNLNKTFIFY